MYIKAAIADIQQYIIPAVCNMSLFDYICHIKMT